MGKGISRKANYAAEKSMPLDQSAAGGWGYLRRSSTSCGEGENEEKNSEKRAEDRQLQKGELCFVEKGTEGKVFRREKLEPRKGTRRGGGGGTGERTRAFRRSGWKSEESTRYRWVMFLFQRGGYGGDLGGER